MTSPGQPPQFGKIRFGPALAVALYALLFGSAVIALWVWRNPGELRGPLARLSPWLFLLFVVAFAVYRWVLVKSGRYPASKAFFQIGAGVLFFTLLLQQTKLDADAAPENLETLLADANPRVRVLAAEVAKCRPDAIRWAPALARALEEDGEPEVQRQAHASLVQLAGQDLGPPEDARAVRAWRERYP